MENDIVRRVRAISEKYPFTFERTTSETNNPSLLAELQAVPESDDHKRFMKLLEEGAHLDTTRLPLV